MTFSAKISELQNIINTTYSSFASTLTTTYNGDFANSIIYALRTIGKEARVCMKTILVPIIPNIFNYSILPTLYSKSKFDYVRASILNICTPSYNSDGILCMNYRDEVDIDLTTIEKFETANLDLIGIAHKHSQNSSVLKIVNGYYDSSPTYRGKGAISAVTSPNVIKSLKTNFVSTPVAGDTVYNLDVFDSNLQYAIGTVASVASGGSGGTATWDLTMNEDVVLTTGDYKWAATDIIAVADGEMSFLSVTEQVIPTIDYIGASDLSNEIPILNQFVDDINPLCLKYLFGILTVRDVEKAGIYATMLKTGLIKSEAQVINDIRKRLDTVDPIVIKQYTPITNQYGR